MKISKKVFLGVILIVLIVASFCAGKYLTRVENTKARSERCGALIGFAIDKAENGDLADQGTMKAYISNVYAAYQFCDNSVVANQLHDLWNFLIFESDGNLENAKEIALIELKDALRSIRVSD